MSKACWPALLRVHLLVSHRACWPALMRVRVHLPVSHKACWPALLRARVHLLVSHRACWPRAAARAYQFWRSRRSHSPSSEIKWWPLPWLARLRPHWRQHSTMVSGSEAISRA